MQATIRFQAVQKYLPTKRHRKLRACTTDRETAVEIREVREDAFPVAFVIHNCQSVYENARSYNDFDGNGDFRMFSEEIRTDGSRLYRPVRVSHGAAVSLTFEDPLPYIRSQLEFRARHRVSTYGIRPLTEQEHATAIIKDDSTAECEKSIRMDAEDYVIHGGKAWQACSEPMYVINTFGLGHNHGGTGFSITYDYNPNISRDSYFNALHREEAIAYGKETARRRGDTLSIEGMGEHESIEVRMPEMVRRDPQAEHGEGDRFMEALKHMTENTDSATEAGLLAIAMASEEIYSMGQA